MISYIIKDNNDIIGVYKKLDDAYDFIIFLNIYVNKKMKTNLNNIIKNIKIYKYKNNIIKKIYYINSKLKLKLIIQDNIINNNTDYEIQKNKDDGESSEINIFIPNETEINDYEVQNMDDIKEKINLLEKLKQHENDKLQDLKEDYINKEEKYIEEKIKIDNKKLKLKQEQEKWDSIKTKFEADKKLYYLFKKEIEDNIREKDDIPELFENIYPIFEKLDNDGYLNTIQEINKYVELKKNL
jgi:hypothetical protein